MKTVKVEVEVEIDSADADGFLVVPSREAALLLGNYGVFIPQGPRRARCTNCNWVCGNGVSLITRSTKTEPRVKKKKT
jgi:hypothetical protein